MPTVAFSTLPDAARTWVFAAAAPLAAHAGVRMLEVVDWYLSRWHAHGNALVAARDWRDDRFLAVAVDEAATGASGCSIDGLFRTLAALEDQLGTSMVGAGRIYWRDSAGNVQSGSRSEFTNAAQRGEINAATPVFDLTITTAGDWRTRFERPAAESWHAKFLGERVS